MAGIWLNCRSHAAGRAIRFSGVQFARKAITQSTSFLRGRCHRDMSIGVLTSGDEVPDPDIDETVTQRGSWIGTRTGPCNFYRSGDDCRQFA